MANRYTNSRNRSRSYSRTSKQSNTIKRTILFVIALAVLAVILFLLFQIFNQPDKLVAQKIDELVADYYENTFYRTIAESDAIKNGTSGKTVEEIIKKYSKFGTEKITLHQMMLYDNDRHTETFNYVGRYCDTTNTYVFYYPHEPYGKTDYDAKINYSCNF